MGMNYEILKNKFVSKLLHFEENYETVEFILDGDMAYSVASVLRDELGKDFYYESERDDFDYLLQNNDILGIILIKHENKVTYYLEEVVYNGITLEAEMDKYYIQDSLLTFLDLERLDGEKFILDDDGNVITD